MYRKWNIVLYNILENQSYDFKLLEKDGEIYYLYLEKHSQGMNHIYWQKVGVEGHGMALFFLR